MKQLTFVMLADQKSVRNAKKEATDAEIKMKA